jgi:hypothetical protein
MIANAGSEVKPRYKGIDNWEVKDVAEISKPLEWNDDSKGEVHYLPRILWLQSKGIKKALWFAYWITNKRGNLAHGQRPPVLEESTLLELMTSAIRQGFFSAEFLSGLKREIEAKLEK